jgi:hypothetical protein
MDVSVTQKHLKAASALGHAGLFDMLVCSLVGVPEIDTQVEVHNPSLLVSWEFLR